MDAIPDLRMGEFLRLAMQFLWEKPKGASSREILAYLSRNIKLTEAENSSSSMSPNFLNYEVLVEVALIAVAKAGWLTRERFKWCLTNEGRLAFQDFATTQEFYAESQKIFSQFQANHSMALMVSEEAEEKSWDQIRNYLLGLSHHEFRQLVKDLLEAMSYHVIWSAPPEKERGSVDIIACADPLGMRQPRLVIQIKHAGQPISEEGMETALTVLGTKDVGLIISTGGFTPEAKELVRLQYASDMAIMDIERFFDLWVEHYEKLPRGANQRLPLRTVYFLSESQ
jgi:restriction system protein